METLHLSSTKMRALLLSPESGVGNACFLHSVEVECGFEERTLMWRFHKALVLQYTALTGDIDGVGVWNAPTRPCTVLPWFEVLRSVACLHAYRQHR